MNARNQQKRRRDSWTAERVDLAALAARAFDLHAARNYLRLSGIRSELIASFSSRYPNGLRTAEPGRTHERRRAG
jgi:hypothetical protein